MRISDWSSDVCSSDLTWREALRADFAPWFDDLHFGLACGDGWRVILRDLTTAIAQIVGGPDREPGLRVTQVKEKYGTLRVYVSGLPALHSDAVEARSEEHTSELQSLMRTSYAVFC